MPRPLLKFVRPKGVPPGPLETEIVRPVLEQHGLVARRSRSQRPEGEEEDEWDEDEEPEPWFAEKLRMYFEVQRPEVADVEVFSVWAAGELVAELRRQLQPLRADQGPDQARGDHLPASACG